MFLVSLGGDDVDKDDEAGAGAGTEARAEDGVASGVARAPEGIGRERGRGVYYVRSLHGGGSRRSGGGGGGDGARGGRGDGGGGGGGSYYEVRPQAWHCSCAAFAFACSGPTLGDRFGAEEGLGSVRRGGGWGGLMVRREGAVEVEAVCKHLLAAALGEWWSGARGKVVRRTVGREEWCAWAAGWGD